MNTPTLIAECSANHLGRIDRAMQIVQAAAAAGADAVKFQCWSPHSMCVSDYRIESGPWTGRLLSDLYQEAWTPWEWFPRLFAHARELGLEPFASVFDLPALAFVDGFGPRWHKIASAEIVDLQLVRATALAGRAMIISTGMASASEIGLAVRYTPHKDKLTLLRCVSAYPSEPREADLATIPKMREIYGAAVGLSDHTMSNVTAVAAIALGATMIEKHLTLARADGGPDAGFSLEPDEFKRLVADCRTAAAAIGHGHLGPTASEKPTLALRRSLWWRSSLERGAIVRGADIVSARPALGMSPTHLGIVIGKVLRRPVNAGEPVAEADLT